MLIGEIAKLANLSKDGIRHYEQLGLIPSSPRKAGGRVYRDYDFSVLEKIENIRQMQQLGFSLKEMGPIFEAYEAAKPVPKLAMIAFLDERLAVIRGKLDDLRGVEAFICKKLETYRADLALECEQGELRRGQATPQAGGCVLGAGFTVGAGAIRPLRERRRFSGELSAAGWLRSFQREGRQRTGAGFAGGTHWPVRIAAVQPPRRIVVRRGLAMTAQAAETREQMRTDLDHLPEPQQGELRRVVAILTAEFEKAVAGGLQPFRKSAQILKIILFGSYARGDWVDEPENGYQSDFDLLIIVGHEKLTNISDYWYVAEDRLLRDETIPRTVNIIVHTLQEVNSALASGQYFFTDIVRDGIVLYELPRHPLARAKPATAKEAFEAARGYFEDWSAKIASAIKLARYALDEGEQKDAAFLLHQATERSYVCYLLVRTLYFPRSHNIKFLRSLAEQAEARLIEVWPRDSRVDRRRFELLKRAYIEARYSANYEIGADDLKALVASVGRLREVVEVVCRERLEVLRCEADGGQSTALD